MITGIDIQHIRSSAGMVTVRVHYKIEHNVVKVEKHTFGPGETLSLNDLDKGMLIPR